MTIILFVLMICALAAAAFCAGVETGLVSLNRLRVTHMAREGSKGAKILSKALTDLPNVVTNLLVGNNLASVAFSSSSAALSELLFPQSLASRFAWSIFAALLVLYLSEFLPKLFLATRPLQRMLFLAPWLKVFDNVMHPVGKSINSAISLFVKRKRDSRPKVTGGDILRILEDRKDGVRLTDFESALISRILVLRRKNKPITVENLISSLD